MRTLAACLIAVFALAVPEVRAESLQQCQDACRASDSGARCYNDCKKRVKVQVDCVGESEKLCNATLKECRKTSDSEQCKAAFERCMQPITKAKLEMASGAMDLNRDLCPKKAKSKSAQKSKSR